MSNKRITDLTELTNPTTDDVLPIVDIATNTTQKVQVGNLPTTTAVTNALATKQDTLVSGTNIKTVNSTSLLGSGDIVIAANPSGVAGAIQFSDGSAFASDATNFFWNNTTKRLGVGTNAPTTSLQIDYSSSSLNGILINQTGGTSNFSSIGFANNGTIRSTLGMNLNSGEVRWFNSSNGYFATIYSNGVEAMRIDTSQNVNIGATALAAKVGIKGSGSTSATTSLLVQNSAGTELFKVQDNANATFGNIVNAGGGFRFSVVSELYLNCRVTTTNPISPQERLFSAEGSPSQTLIPTTSFHDIRNFIPTSGSALFTSFQYSGTINQTGGANGITRGLYINPTLTAAADFRAIQTTAGKIIFGGLPTSSAGLVSGQIWNDAGTIKIV